MYLQHTTALHDIAKVKKSALSYASAYFKDCNRKHQVNRIDMHSRPQTLDSAETLLFDYTE